MSRNRNRLKVPQQNSKNTKQNHPAPPPEIAKTPEMGPFGLSFVVPTEIVPLPSGGKFYGEHSGLHGLAEVEVKSVTAAEEDIIINDNYIQQGIVFDKLIDSIMITPGVSASELMDCDKIAILMSARKTGYGDIIAFNDICTSCGHEHAVDISLSSILENNSKKSYNPESTEEHQYNSDSGTFSFVLPQTKLTATIRILGPDNINHLSESKKQKDKLGLPFNETLEFIRHCLVSVEGVMDRASLNKLIEILPASDARKIKVVHNNNKPKINTTQDITCPNCNNLQSKEVPFSLGWFWS